MIKQNLLKIKANLPEDVVLVVVSKFRSMDELKEVYACGERDFAENRVQELMSKQGELPNDIRWHLIGHLQRNKVKFIAPFVHLIHSVDSLELALEINKQAASQKRTLSILLQFHIAEEDSKFGFETHVNLSVLEEINALPHVKVCGVMGMATLTSNETKVREEFKKLFEMFNAMKQDVFRRNENFKTVSMGMSGDYKIAVQEGSTMVRIGSLIFE